VHFGVRLRLIQTKVETRLHLRKPRSELLRQQLRARHRAQVQVQVQAHAQTRVQARAPAQARPRRREVDETSLGRKGPASENKVPRRYLSFSLAKLSGERNVPPLEEVDELGMRRYHRPYRRQKLPPRTYIKCCKNLHLHWLASKKLIRKGTVRLLVQGYIILELMREYETLRFYISNVIKWADRKVAYLRNKFNNRPVGAVMTEGMVLRYLGRQLPIHLGPTLRLKYDDLRQVIQARSLFAIVDLC